MCFSALGFHVVVCGIFGAICAISPVPFFSSHILNHCHSRSRSLRSITMKQFGISTIITSFHSLLLSVFIAITALQLQPIDVNALTLPTDVLEEIVEEMIEKYNITCVRPKRASGDDGGSMPKERKHVKYDRARAYNAVIDDWLRSSPLP